jgi:hypothetical protein
LIGQVSYVNLNKKRLSKSLLVAPNSIYPIDHVKQQQDADHDIDVVRGRRLALTNDSMDVESSV